MNILVVRANPRKNGYTQYITDLVIEGAREGGAEIEDIDLASKKIANCIGCYHCWTVSPGHCRFDDDMGEILHQILRCDCMLCATPLYYYSPSSLMKKFLERTLPLTMQGFEKTPRGLLRNLTRYPNQWRNKSLAYITAGAFKNMDNYAAIRETFRLIAQGLNMDIAAEIIRPESYLIQFELAKPKTVKTVETALKRAGMELATKKVVSENTLRNAALPLSVDVAHFLKYSNIYWEYAIELGQQSEDLGKVQKAVIGDVRILLSEMARSIDPCATARLKAVIQFDFPDKDIHYRLSVNKGKCNLEKTSSDKCDLRITVDTSTWASIFTREINVRDALIQKKIILEGDKMLFTRLDRYFPPPVS